MFSLICKYCKVLIPGGWCRLHHGTAAFPGICPAMPLMDPFVTLPSFLAACCLKAPGGLIIDNNSCSISMIKHSSKDYPTSNDQMSTFRRDGSNFLSSSDWLLRVIVLSRFSARTCLRPGSCSHPASGCPAIKHNALLSPSCTPEQKCSEVPGETEVPRPGDFSHVPALSQCSSDLSLSHPKEWPCSQVWCSRVRG